MTEIACNVWAPRTTALERLRQERDRITDNLLAAALVKLATESVAYDRLTRHLIRRKSE